MSASPGSERLAEVLRQLVALGDDSQVEKNHTRCSKVKSTEGAAGISSLKSSTCPAHELGFEPDPE